MNTWRVKTESFRPPISDENGRRPRNRHTNAKNEDRPSNHLRGVRAARVKHVGARARERAHGGVRACLQFGRCRTSCVAVVELSTAPPPCAVDGRTEPRLMKSLPGAKSPEPLPTAELLAKPEPLLNVASCSSALAIRAAAFSSNRRRPTMKATLGSRNIRKVPHVAPTI